MALLQRLTTPFVALLPDLNNVPQQRQAVGAIVASLVFHLLLLLFFVAMAGLVPDMRVDFAKPQAELQPLELTVIDTSPPPPPPEEKAVDLQPAEAAPAEFLTPAELAERAKPIIDSAGLARSEEAPKNAVFESDQNMKAASELPGTGDPTLPSQKGLTLEARPMFANQDSVLGKAVPEPLVGPKPEMVQEEPAAQAPRATPVPAPEVPTPADDQIAIAPKMTEVADGPVTKLAPAFRTRPVPSPQERTELAKLATPQPMPQRPTSPEDQGFRDEQMKTQVDGGISNLGQNSVDAERGVRGLYARQVQAAFGSRWYYFMKRHPDRYLTGYAVVRYAISREGKISNVRVIENTSNASFGLMCEQSVREAEVVPPPAEILETLGDGEKFEDVCKFNYVPSIR